MSFTLLLFAALIGQASLGNPTRYLFSKVELDQSTMYTMLSSFSNVGKLPIYFPVSNSSADYTSDVWMDPCYERFYEVGAHYVVYWLVNRDMYCEALVKASATTVPTKPLYEQQHLARVERKKTWCPPELE
uniref:Glycosyltransferase family 92 protein n=1 Tax=Caenorhabditis japonica TaxID=281687 RepID=A0A8R1EER9_CAEJA